MDYYVFTVEATATSFLGAINAHSIFGGGGIVGNVAGQPAPTNQKTEKWEEAPEQMLDGRWAIPKIPQEKIDFYGISQADVDAINASFTYVVEDLTVADFPEPEE